jgi:hypothetical protein
MNECKRTNESIDTLKGRVERKAYTNKTFNKSVLSSRSSRYASKRLVFGGLVEEANEGVQDHTRALICEEDVFFFFRQKMYVLHI